MKKVLLAILIIVLVLGVGIYFYLRQNKLTDFQPLIKERLAKLVSEASGGLYRLDIESLQTDVVGGKITIVNAHLWPDTAVYARMEQSKTAPNDIFDVVISQFSLDDIDPGKFLANKEINLGRLFINKPVIKVWHKKQPYNIPDSNAVENIYQQIKKDINRIKVDTIILQDIDFVYTNKDRKDKQTHLSNLKLSLSDILIDSSTQNDRERFLYAGNCFINLKNYSLDTNDSLYRFKVGDIQIETRHEVMRLSSVAFKPRLPEKTFYRKIGHQKDMFELVVPAIHFSSVKWWALLAEESFFASKVDITNGKIKVYNDKSQPADIRSKVGKYPHQLLMKLPFLLKIDSLLIDNLDLSYTELNPKSGMTGTLRFDHIQGLATHLTNMPEEVRKDPFCRINANARFMQQANIRAEFSLDLAHAENGNFTAKASMGNLKGESLNSITMPLAMLKVNSLNIKSLDVSMRCNNYGSTGTVKLLYDDLKVTALKATEDTFKKRGLFSFIANTFIIKKANPLNDNPIRVESVTFKRDTQKSFFNLIWKTIFTGSAKTVGYNKK